VHLLARDLPQCWIPPGHVLEARAVVRLYKDLVDERGAWHQRIAAALFHQGASAGTGSTCTAEGRAAVAGVDLSAAGRQVVETGLRQIDRLTGELDPLRRQLAMLSRRQPGCAALRAACFGIGPVTSVAIWTELGDVRRFASSDNVVRHTGLDITVYSSDTKHPAGHLSRQGPPLLRWALYEAAKSAAEPAAPDPRPNTDEPAASSANSLLSQSPQAPGQPPKNERPHPQPGHPITHQVAGAKAERSAHRDKPGRPARRGASTGQPPAPERMHPR
jgi:hypothetical protein